MADYDLTFQKGDPNGAIKGIVSGRLANGKLLVDAFQYVNGQLIFFSIEATDPYKMASPNQVIGYGSNIPLRNVNGSKEWVIG